MPDQTDWISLHEAALRLAKLNVFFTLPDWAAEAIAKAMRHGVPIRAVRFGDRLPDIIDWREIHDVEAHYIWFNALLGKDGADFSNAEIDWERLKLFLADLGMMEHEPPQTLGHVTKDAQIKTLIEAEPLLTNKEIAHRTRSSERTVSRARNLKKT